MQSPKAQQFEPLRDCRRQRITAFSSTVTTIWPNWLANRQELRHVTFILKHQSLNFSDDQPHGICTVYTKHIVPLYDVNTNDHHDLHVLGNPYLQSHIDKTTSVLVHWQYHCETTVCTCSETTSKTDVTTQLRRWISLQSLFRKMLLG